MAIIANTYLTYDIKGAREDLSDLIANIAPEDTPVLSASRKGTVKNTKYEWQRDTLAAPASNSALRGDDIAAFPALVATVRMSNRTQIMRKLILVEDGLEVISKAGRESELGYQTALKSAELKRDQELALVGSLTQVATPGSSGVAPLFGNLLAMVGSIDGGNVDMGATGTNPTDAIDFTDARNDGTQRVFAEANLKTVLSGVYTKGGNPDTIMVGPVQKGVVSGFAGIATKTYNQDAKKPAAIIGAADTYVGDFGVYSVIPNRFQRNRDAWVLDFDAIRVVSFRAYRVVELAKTGDATKRMLLTEFGLKLDHEQRLGLVADLS